MVRLENEPPGWRELRAKLEKEADRTKFIAILEEIDRLLTAYEKAHPENGKKENS